MTLKSSAFPRAFGGEGGSSLVQTSQVCLLPTTTSLLRLLLWVPHPWSPKLFMSLPHLTVSLCGSQKEDTLLNMASKSHSDVASPPLSQCICVSHTGLLVAPQTHLTLCLHILALSATPFVFLSTSYSFIKAVPASPPLGGPF